MIIPEIILEKFINSCLELVRADYAANVGDPTKSILYSLFHVDDNNEQIKREKYIFFTQAVNMFTRTNENPNKLEVNIGYNLERATSPTIHIMLPNENKGRYDSLGDQGNTDNVYNVSDQIMTVTKQTSYSPLYNLLLTSSNSSEVLLIYYFLRSMFVIFKEHLEIKGIHNLKISGADIMFQQDMAPNHIFHRSMNLDFDYVIDLKVNIPAQLASTFNLNICAEIGDEFNDYIG